VVESNQIVEKEENKATAGGQNEKHSEQDVLCTKRPGKRELVKKQQ
jgi:hypothetical protein